MILIGLDAASDRRKFGYAIGRSSGATTELLQSGCLEGGSVDGMGAIKALTENSVPRLLAIDAPLGWPDGLRDGLKNHVAGQHIPASKHLTFRRQTDLRLRSKEHGAHQPLEVGADRIARAAHEALSVLKELRARSGLALPLLWQSRFDGAGVIEVYPAATLRASGLLSRGYKLVDQLAARKQISESLQSRLPDLASRCESSGDEFDACLCLLAGMDFANGFCSPPSDELKEAAIREGWIWVRRHASDGVMS
jgi:predicted nuclease with RNAse H fold